MCVLILVRIWDWRGGDVLSPRLSWRLTSVGQFRQVFGTAPWELAKRAPYNVPLATVHAGPLGRSRAYAISCLSLRSLAGVSRLGS